MSLRCNCSVLTLLLFVTTAAADVPRAQRSRLSTPDRPKSRGVHDGEWDGKICGGITGEVCDNPDAFCRLPIGKCCCDQQGVCTVPPQACPDVYDPVCGCDGVTYGNACEAYAESMSIEHTGTCGTLGVCCFDITDGPIPWETCEDTTAEVCEAAGGLFHELGTSCADVQACCFSFTGFTFCADLAAGCCIVSGGTPQGEGSSCGDNPGGVCEEICGGVTGIPCTDPDDFCKLPLGKCCCDFTGVCTPMPQGCPDVYDPVCGCDGVTYGNECEADAAGVSVNHPGECGLPGVCCFDVSDGPIEWETCEDTTAPVCEELGGVFFDEGTSCADVQACCLSFPGTNFCAEIAVGCCLLSGGEPLGEGTACGDPDALCPEICGGVTGIPCTDPGDFCKLPLGKCCCDFMGVCTHMPEACPEYYDPVCGCDGVTYGNECEADAAGVSVDFHGDCDMPGVCCFDISDGPIPWETCEETTATACEEQGGMFFDEGSDCADIQACCLSFAGFNYCADIAAGCCIVSGGVPQGEASSCADDPNPCPEICGGVNGIPCSNSDEFCKFPLGECCCDITGECTPIPDGCPENYDPVCGCDGITYGNECEAEAAAVSVEHLGPCETFGICCLDISDGPVPWETCEATTESACLEAGGLFDGSATSCEPTSACCFGFACVDLHSSCCLASGGLPQQNALCLFDVCPQVCGGLLGVICEDPSTYCSLPVGACCCDQQGLCLPRPENCLDVWIPVCGCDGNTYSNECYAAAAGISIAYEGHCVP